VVKHSVEALCVIGELCRIQVRSGFIRLCSGCKALAVFMFWLQGVLAV
jgi:hypothetical protein